MTNKQPELALNTREINIGYMEYNKMRELNINEIGEVNGGLSMEDGGVASLALAATAATVGAPFAMGFGLAVGVGLIWGAFTRTGGSGSWNGLLND